jgi:hypothetical protein
VFTLQARDEPLDDVVGTVAVSSLHAGVAVRANERRKLERPCRHISSQTILILFNNDLSEFFDAFCNNAKDRRLQ